MTSAGGTCRTTWALFQRTETLFYDSFEVTPASYIHDDSYRPKSLGQKHVQGISAEYDLKLSRSLEITMESRLTFLISSSNDRESTVSVVLHFMTISIFDSIGFNHQKDAILDQR